MMVYKLVAGAEALAGKNVDKIAKRKEIHTIAKSMNLSPSDEREVISFLESSVNRQKIKTILRVGETEAAKMYQTFSSMFTSDGKVYDELEQSYKSIKDMEKQLNGSTAELEALRQGASEMQGTRNVKSAELDELNAAYVRKYNAYRAQLVRLDMKKIKTDEELQFATKALEDEIARIKTGNAHINKELRGARKDAGQTRKPNTQESMANAKVLDMEFRAEEARLTQQIRELGKAPSVDKEAVRVQVDALKAERDIVTQKLRVLNVAEEKSGLLGNWNRHEPSTEYRNAITSRVEAFKKMEVKKAADVTDGAPQHTVDAQKLHDAKFGDVDVRELKRAEITTLVSEYVFGRRGMVASLSDQMMDDMAKLINDGHSPAYISTLPLIRDKRILTERGIHTYQLVANQLGYKSYDKKFRQPLKRLEKEMQMNRGKLEPEDMQEYIRLKAVDEQRTKLLDEYNAMSDKQFNRVAGLEERKHLEDSFDEMMHGLEGSWGDIGKVSEESKALINPETFLDDAMREMREMSRDMKPKDKDVFIKEIMEKLRPMDAPPIPARMPKVADEVADTSNNMRAGGKPVSEAEETISLMSAAHNTLQKRFGGRAYDDLTSAEQKMFMRSVLHRVVGKEDKWALNKAIALQAKKQKDLMAEVTKRETLRDTVYEGFVVHAREQTGTVLARTDTDADTFFDVLMADGQLLKLTPDDITGVSRNKVYDAKQVIASKPMQEMLGNKKKLINDLRAINKQISDAGKAKANPHEKLIKELEAKKSELYTEYTARLDAFQTKGIPTKQSLVAEKKVTKLEAKRDVNRAEIASLRKALKKEQDVYATKMDDVNKLQTRELDALRKSMQTITRDYGEKKTAMERMLDSFDERLRFYEEDITDYINQVRALEDTIEALGGKTTVDAFEDAVKNIEKLEKSLNDVDVLEDFIRVQMTKQGQDFDKWAKQTMEDESGLTALLKTIDDSSLTEKQKFWARLVRRDFFKAGLDEVRIGKLKPEQFEAMTSTYVYHKASPEFLAHKQALEEATGHSTPTQHYGFDVKWSPSSKERTSNMNIEEFNLHMSEALKGGKAFSDNLGEIYVARMLKHEELMYDNKVTNTFMERFGIAWKEGDELKEGYGIVANFSKVREMFSEQARRLMSEELKQLARANGGARAELTEMELRAMFDKHLKTVLPRYGFDDLAIMEGKTLPLLELTPKQIEALTPSGLVYQMSEALTGSANNARKIKMAKDEHKLLQIYDKFLHFIKLHQTALMPAFHIKNKYSNAFQNYLAVGADAVNPRLQMDSARVIMANGDVSKIGHLKPIISADGTKVYHWNDIYDDALNWGVIDEGFFAQDLSKMTESEGLLKGVMPGKFDPTSTSQFAPYKFATRVGGKVEGSDRLLHFAAMLKQGKTVEEAAESATKYLFDYSDLTPFERTWMKRIFPYYTWIRKNSRLQMGEIIEQPEKYLMVAKAHSGIEGMNNEDDLIDRNLLPAFAQDWIQTPFTTTNGNGQKVPVMLSPNMPYMDLGRLPDIFNPVASAREWFGMTSPIMKVPLELATNYNAFFNQNIVKHDEENPEDNTEHPNLARLRHVAKQLGWYTAAENVATSKGSTQGFHVLNTLAGVKLMNQNEIYAREMIMKGLYEGNSDLGRAVTDYTEEIRTRLSNTVHLVQGGASELLEDGVLRLTGAPPMKPGDYTGALAPISRETYASLSPEAREKYAPPSTEEYTVYAKEAQRLSDEAYAETGIMKKFVWSLFDTMDDVEDSMVLRVSNVADGDTFTVKQGDNEFNIRMLMVDTPETVDPDMDAPMPYGKEASDFTKSMIMGKDVTLTFQGRDAYGRALAYVELDGDDFNQMLITEGLGKMRYLDGTTDTSRYMEYRATERKAAKDKRGLWSVDGYARPGKDEGYGLAE